MAARDRAASRSSSRLAFSSCSTVALATEGAPTSRLTRPLIARCASPVRRATAPDELRRSSRSRSRRS